ncbi:MAG: prepilin-type N-terminal cleavage/methylation domain-containing protein [Candidatus Calescibacterium sp.]|nr:prepilin-type N-terminal cleavage/methylation domain-containing protein [Candidatus Calescibacterium sp.]MDW8133060.1 prepilin-type N-terminal cleavage/methylation domain-containing protein [Candidatus Calescibacterium sp.]
MKKFQGLTLIETIISIGIISLLLTIIVQILLTISKYNRKIGYVQEADIKAKEVALKIEKLLYNKGFLNIKKVNSHVLYIYSYNEEKDSEQTFVQLYYKQNKINKKNYRKVVLYFDKTNRTNLTYLPDNVFWKIEETCVFRSKQKLTTFYTYNFNDNNNPIKIEKSSSINRSYHNIIFQNLSISFYVYTSDPQGREFSKYIKDTNWKQKAKEILVYFINIINITP